MHKHKTTGFLFSMLTLFLIGTLLFLVGFFPVSFQDMNQSSAEIERPTSIESYKLLRPTAKYNRILLMIVDAMRTDFFTESYMPFAFVNACARLQIKVDIPTVTMPRIKSLIVGTLSSFTDIVLNLGSSEQLEDSLLHRIKMNGDVAIFAGDRTWVELFPTMFKRHQANMDSLYVNDFYKGDENVTKTILSEINQHDWNLFITHYLGLDHIGHVEGSVSSKIPFKLREMDDVINTVLTSPNNSIDLLIVTGDHGMRNGGGHGGGTTEEMFVPLLAFQPHCIVESRPHVSEEKQIDLTPTLATLMLSKIPKQSIGCILPDLINHLSLEDQLYAFYYNTLHLLNKAYEKFGKEEVITSDYYKWITSAKQMHIDFLKSKQIEGVSSSFNFENAKRDYMRASRELSNKLADSLAFFKYDLMTVGIILSSLVTINTLIFVLFFDSRDRINTLPRLKDCLLIMGCSLCIILSVKYVGFMEFSSFSSWLIILPIGASFYIFGNIAKVFLQFTVPYKHERSILQMPLPLMVCFIFHTCSLASSSFIEEEHQTWYYFGCTLLIALGVRSFQKSFRDIDFVSAKQFKWFILQEFWNFRSTIVMLSIVALARKLNQTGDKWKHLQDFSDVLNNNENMLPLSLFFLLGLLMIVYFVRCLTKPLQLVACLIASLCIYAYRGLNKMALFYDTDRIDANIFLAGFWLCLLFIAIYRYRLVLCSRNTNIYSSHAEKVELLKTNLTCSILISALLHKPHNVILLFSMLFTLQETFRLCDYLQRKNNWRYGKSYDLIYKTALTIIISKMFYFYQGNSNSLATIDLNPGFIGQSSYNPLLAVTFVTLNTYSAQINAFMYLLMHMFANFYDSQLQVQKKDLYFSTKSITTTQQDLETVVSLYTLANMLPAALYLLLLILFRHHLFIYSVFAPKALYESFNVVVFYFNFTIMNLYFLIVK